MTTTTTNTTITTTTITTRFTELVGCTLPVQQAPMGSVGGTDLVVASVEAGALGMAAFAGYPVEAVVATLAGLNERTSGPIGGNFLVPFLDDRAVLTACAERSRLVDLYHGEPEAGIISLIHVAGALVSWQVGSVDDAVRAVDCGVDLLAVRGVEGGGRMHGDRSLWPLLCEVLDAVGDDVPVLAAGGIGTGRGLAAALAAGADGARIGTVLVATEESDAHPDYKQAVVTSGATDSVLTDDFDTGWPAGPRTARVLRCSLDAAHASSGDTVGHVLRDGRRDEVPRFAPSPPSTAFEGDVAAMPHYAGESVAHVSRIEPVARVLTRIGDDARRLLAGLR